MRSLNNIIKAALTILLLAGIFLINSCQKEQVTNSSKLNEQPVTMAKAKASNNITLAGLPDLTIDGARLQSSAVVKTAVFKSNSCAVAEGCVAGTGKRKLLRFDVATPNIGDADLYLGDPSANSLFEYSTCHKHYHFKGYALYELLNTAGTTILTGRKQAFCLEDFAKYDPNAGPAKYTCANQGISVGWQDIYGSYLDCQWLDITGIAAGNYKLRVSINPEQLLTESNYTNNIATVPVTISK